MSPLRPVPVPDELSQPFWRAVDDRRLVVQRCARCSRFHHPPTGMCTSCLSTSLDFAEVSGVGTVVSYTLVHEARHPAFAAAQPYVVAAVRLDEQDDLFYFTNLPGVSADDVVAGLRVTVVFEELGDGHLIPEFTSLAVEPSA